MLQRRTTNTTYNRMSDQLKRDAISLLLGTEDINSEVFTKISKFIDKKFRTCNCCVMYGVSKEFNNLLNSLDIDIGRKEVVITENYDILFSPDYKLAPEIIS